MNAANKIRNNLNIAPDGNRANNANTGQTLLPENLEEIIINAFTQKYKAMQGATLSG